jgi:2-isopropylmalate synthase
MLTYKSSLGYTMSHAKKIQVLDSTLREGEQALGICFSVHEKIALAQSLKKFGVPIIEIGHPGISASEEEICRKICESVQNVDLLVHARACEADILAAKNSKARWVGIWISYNDLSLQTKFSDKSRDWIKTQVENSILLAKKLGLKVRFTIEDASRTDNSLIHELGMVAVNAGVDRISLADTVGAWHPSACFRAVQYAVETFACEIEVHLHNDLGLAHANAIAAIDAGAFVIDATVLGVGERAGICDLFAICAVLEKFYDMPPYHWEISQELTKLTSRVGSFVSEPHHAIVGRNAFTHASKYHIKAAVNNPAAYESLEPEHFGAKRKNILNNLERGTQQRFLNTLKIGQPFVKSASELKYHRDGVGQRWVLMDKRIDERSSAYIIERIFDKDYSEVYQPHVDAHTHHCDSFFVFMGDNPDGTGLTVSVSFGSGNDEVTKTFSSPASVFIPAHVIHSYRYLNGTGRFLNFVLSPSYNESLILD